MSEQIWHSGPPPYIGWWNASTNQNREYWRWWNGKVWSHVLCDDDVMPSLKMLSLTFDCPCHIQWTDFWPENARVPRIDPGTPRPNAAALSALNDLDDFARMAGIKATGALKVLADFINSVQP